MSERKGKIVTDQVAKASAPRARKARVVVPFAAAPDPDEAAPIALPQPAKAAPALPKAIENIAAPIEAATSPAVQSDIPNVSAADAAPITSEGLETMATIAPPTDAADKAQAMFGDVTSRFKSAFEKSSKLGEEMVEFNKGNVEALIASARAAAKAAESLGQEAADYGKKNFESATAAFKSFATVKSPTELFQLQSEFAKASFDSAVAEASRLSESMMKLAGDIAQPLSNRYALAAEKIKGAAL